MQRSSDPHEVAQRWGEGTKVPTLHPSLISNILKSQTNPLLCRLFFLLLRATLGTGILLTFIPLERGSFLVQPI